MITLLIGHRGVGKTALLSRLREYGAAVTYDLDQEVESSTGKSIATIFSEEGESAFRKWEEQVLHTLVAAAKPGTFIAVGAGYAGALPKGTRRWWVRRSTDGNGRIFLNRPRLNLKISPLAEYRERFSVRDVNYSEACSSEISLLEGFQFATEWERKLLEFDEANAHGIVTILPERLRSGGDFYLQRLARLKPWKVEVRDDFLSKAEQNHVAKFFSESQVLFSHRRGVAPDTGPWPGAIRDWALELGVSRTDAEILSCHQRQESIGATFDSLPGATGSILKAAIPIRSFRELQVGHDWWLQDPERRSFLPISEDGRWSWYRLRFGRQMPLAFWREGAGSAADQPLLGDWLRTADLDAEEFAAIVGWPVTHSFTPAEQSEFFAQWKMPVLAVPVSESEWNPDTLEFLTATGLRAAAVTSPLKIATSQLCGELTEDARRLGAVNTLKFKNGCWAGHNTDLAGFENLAELSVAPVAVWGGGGTSAVMRDVLPEAEFFSARHAGDEALSIRPETVIWAVGRDAITKGAQMPPLQWKPKRILDLNYSEDSPGRELALMTGADYVSGLLMFRAQAAQQREFWQSD